MDDPQFLEYRAWRVEAAKFCSVATKPPTASRLPSKVDVPAIRTRLRLVMGGQPIAQEAIARRFGFSVAAVRAWKRGRCTPDTASGVIAAGNQRHAARSGCGQ